MRAGGYYLLLTKKLLFIVHYILYRHYYAAAYSMDIITGPSANESHSIKCNNKCRCSSLKGIQAGDRKQGIYKAWPY